MVLSESGVGSKNPGIRLPYKPDFQLGVAVSSTELWSHAGIVFLDQDGRLQMLHLAFHHRLRRDPLAVDYAVCVTRLRPERASQVIVLCELIWSRLRSQGIPYGFSLDGINFDSSGNVRITAGCTGLTCSSFVLKVFENVGISLVDVATWVSRPDDQQHHATLVKLLEEHGADPSHVSAVRAQVASVRIRPEEIAYAAHLEFAVLPASMSTVEGPASELLGSLRALFQMQ